MSYLNIKSIISRNFINISGWRTKRKIVIIQSDDWGSIRMSSKKAYQYYIKKGFPVNKCPYNKNDSLESNQDLEYLFDILQAITNTNGDHPIITINMVMGNPDFNQIKQNGFNNYYFELFTKTLEKYPKHDRVYDLYKQGISELLIKPQFHGREHLNVSRWMKALQNKEPYALIAFESEMFSLHYNDISEYRNEYMDAYDYNTVDEMKIIDDIIIEGLELFNKFWGYQSKSFIAPCYIWSNNINKLLKLQNVLYIQSQKAQLEPIIGSNQKYKKSYYFQGEKNKYDQYIFIRNCFFEPSINNNYDWVDNCLKDVSNAFYWSKPAIISSHRLNYIGTINCENRNKNLKMLKILLNKIIEIWPDVEFMSTDILGDIVSKK